MTVTTTIPVAARDLRPGDIVVDEHGCREHAVFDVGTVTPAAQYDTRVFTALSDQQFGWPASYVVAGDTPFTVTRTI